MSWRQQVNGNGAYLNGNGEQPQQLRRFDFEDSSREPSADERSRSRGGLGGYNSQPDARYVTGPARLDRHAANRKSRDGGDWSTSRSRSRPGGRYGESSRQVEG